jgi:hypothetical protein
MSKRRTSKATRSATSSPGSADGPMLYDSLDGQMTLLSGPALVPVNRSQSQASARERTTLGTSGRNSLGLSESVSLQQSLENRLHRQMDVSGSPEYALTWSLWDMPSGPRICALRASQRHTSDSDCGGWPTPCARGDDWSPGVNEASCGGHMLGAKAQLAGWPTATARDHKDGTAESCRNVPTNALLGRAVHGISATTGRPAGYRLNPRFSLWLMGYPTEWVCCGELAMQSCRRSRKHS